jgi:hypothetical protein
MAGLMSNKVNHGTDLSIRKIRIINNGKLLPGLLSTIIVTVIILLVISLIVLSSRIDNTKDILIKAANAQYDNELSNYNSEIRNLGLPTYVQAICYIKSELLYNHGIGNEWSRSFKINGREVNDGDSIILNLLSDNVVESTYVESDPSSDDVGTSTDIVSLDLYQLSNVVYVNQETVITEHYGKGAGESAQYRTSYDIRLSDLNDIEKILSNAGIHQKPTKAISSSNITIWNVLKIDLFSQIVSLALTLSALFYIGAKTKKLKLIEGERLEKLSKEEEKRNKEALERQHYQDVLNNATVEDVANVPVNYRFEMHGLPIDITSASRARYGSLTVYKSQRGTKYHKKYGCSSAYNVIHLYSAIESHLTPCSICAKTTDVIPSWYYEYKRLKGIITKYNLTYTER